MSSHYAQDAVDRSPRSDLRLFRGPFYFLRHGQTQTNVQDLIAGWGDTELTDLGRRQAQSAAELLAKHPISAIYSSALKRARDTAQYVADRLQLPVTTIAELAERNWGVLEGQPRNVRVPGMTPAGGRIRTRIHRSGVRRTGTHRFRTPADRFALGCAPGSFAQLRLAGGGGFGPQRHAGEIRTEHGRLELDTMLTTVELAQDTGPT